MEVSPESSAEKHRLCDTVTKSDMPREKIFSRGRKALSDEELLALFLRTGIQGCNVLQLAARLKKEAGSLANLGQMEAAEIRDLIKGIGPAKAATLAAVFELGHRATRDSMERADMGTARKVYEYLVGELRYEAQEVMCVLLLDARRRLIRMERVAVGTLTRTITHARNIFSAAIRYNASKVIMAHNHPSGSTLPSAQDIAITKNIKEAGELLGIPLLDHVIIGAVDSEQPCPYYSFAEHGYIKS